MAHQDRIRRLIAVVAVFGTLGALAAGSGDARAVAITTAEGVPARLEHRWAARATIPLPDRWTFVSRRQNCPFLEPEMSCVSTSSPETLWLQQTQLGGTATLTHGQMRAVFFHEMWHSVSMRACGGDGRGVCEPWMAYIRTRWLAINAPDRLGKDWWNTTWLIEGAGPVVTNAEEQAADAFAYCAEAYPWNWSHAANPDPLVDRPETEYGWIPTLSRRGATCRLFRNHLR